MHLQNRYVCNHEDDAVTAFTSIFQNDHQDGTVGPCGLVVHLDLPHLGASPDGKLECSCHGSGILEVKYLTCLKEQTFDEAACKKDFCLERNENGALQLKKGHSFYYQLQLQLFLTKANYCCFVLW